LVQLLLLLLLLAVLLQPLPLLKLAAARRP
jgi:hypothetical protein